MELINSSIYNFNNLGEVIIPNFQNKNANNDAQIEYENVKNFNLYKIPKYKEQFLLISSMMVFNDFVFNLIILPIRMLVMIFSNITTFFFNNILPNKKENKGSNNASTNSLLSSHLQQFYLLKLFFVFSSIYVYIVRVYINLI